MANVNGRIDDLAKLIDLDDQTIIQELKDRYEGNIIYTYIGDILVSVNPYTTALDIYGDQIGHSYGDIKLLSDMPPHIYAMATKVYRSVMMTGISQCLLVSGESGAGKTECTKMLVAQIVRISKSPSSNLLQQIKEVNPLLEAFGNAQTIMNDNSSRFGKLIEIRFLSTGAIVGGKVTEHMLEKSRLVHTSQRERTFHIFYSMVAGFSESERIRYFLMDRPESYRLVDPGDGTPVFVSKEDFQRYKDMMIDIKHTMKAVGFSDQDVDLILAIMAGILHLCNLDFVAEPEYGQVIILNENEVDAASTLLSLQAEDLVTKLLANTNWVRGERIVKFKTVSEANDGRDALAKTIYSRMFSWMVQQINLMLHVEYDRRYPIGVISVLDMAGFENFPINSFEQLCINVANEQLQNYFNEAVFGWEMKSYETEGIKPPKIKFINNKEILDLFLQRPGGLFALLEDDCRLATSVDNDFVEKINKQFAKNSHYRKSKSKDPVFTILHYAGQVTYRAEGFIEKNRNTLGTNFQSLMENSQNRLITELFTTQLSETGRLKKGDTLHRNLGNLPEWNVPIRTFDPGESLSKQAGRELKKKMKNGQFEDSNVPAMTTASAYFKNSLSKLLKKMSQGEPHFIRCIKPNSHQRPHHFDEKIVMSQLISTGVLETTKIRKLGYPTRMQIEDFIRRYSIIAFLKPLSQVEVDPNVCRHILKYAGIKNCEIGKSRVFLKYWQTEQLDLALENTIADTINVQRCVRGFLARKLYRRLLHINLQQKHQLAEFGLTLTRGCDKMFHMMVSSSDHDAQKFRQRIEQSRYGRSAGHRPRSIEEFPDYEEPIQSHRSPQPDYYNRKSTETPRGLNRQSMITPVISQETSDKEYLYQNQIRQIMAKWTEIPHDAWCKIIYMEYNKPVAKFYIVDRDVIIDGSYESFEGDKIGLGAFRNPDRDARTEEIRSYIGKGLMLRKDEDGSIHIKKLNKNSIIIKDVTEPQNYCFSEEVIELNGKVPNTDFLRIFEMNQFHSHIGIALEGTKTSDTESLLYRAPVLPLRSIVSVSLLEDHEEIGQTPCWLLIVNIEALRALEDQEVINHVLQKLTQMKTRTEEDVEKEEITNEIILRHKGREWSKHKYRDEKESKAPLRKTRIELRQKGLDINKFMPYSWDEKFRSKKKNKTFSALQEKLDQIDGEGDEPATIIGGYRGTRKLDKCGSSSIGSSLVFNQAPVRTEWAKIRATIREDEND